MQRTIREPHPQPVPGMGERPLDALAERGPHQRRVRLDVRAHDDDVARLERRIVLEQVQQPLPQGLHLPGRAVAGVDLDGVVHRPRRRLPVRGDVGLQLSEQRRGARRSRVVHVDHPDGAEPRLQLAHVAGEAGEQRMCDVERAHVVGAATRRFTVGELPPHLDTRMRNPHVHIAIGAERGQHRDLIGAQPGGPEQRQPFGQFEQPRLVAQPRACGVEALGGAGAADPLAQSPPQLGLPAQVGVERGESVGVAAGRPVDEHRRALRAVRAEQFGQVRGRAVAAAGAVVVGAVTEMAGEDGAPRLGQAVVDHLQQGPQHPRRVPGIVVDVVAGGGRERLVDQPIRRREIDVGGDTIVAGITRTQHVRQPLRQPAFDALRGDRDHLTLERVRKGRDQHLSERGRERAGALGAVQRQQVRISLQCRRLCSIGQALSHRSDGSERPRIATATGC